MSIAANVSASEQATAGMPEPAVAVPCVVCGAGEYEVLCSAQEVHAHHRYLLQFHKRRLVRDRDGRIPDSALTDRVDFTQNYATDIVCCVQCGLIFRNPRPTQEAIARTYAKDQYGHDHLNAAFEAQVKLAREKANAGAEAAENG